MSDNAIDLAPLRASLLRNPAIAEAALPSGPPHAFSPRTALIGATPSAAQVLDASSTAARLCATYAEQRRKAANRGRAQRLGVAGMVCGAMMAAAVLAVQGRIGIALLTDVILAAAVASIAALGALFTLYMRDERRRHELWGQRLVRALGLSCSLPAEHIAQFLAERPAAARFGELFRTWQQRQA